MSAAASGGGKIDRRHFLRLVALGAGALTASSILEACAKSGVPIPPSLRDAARSIGKNEKPDLQLFPGGQEFLANGPQRFPFGITDLDGMQILGPPARVWFGQGSAAQGPFPATLQKFRTVEQQGDPTGFYVASIPMRASGLAWVMAEARGLYGFAPIAVLDAPTTPGVGQRAISVVTPTPGHLHGVSRLCTRKPVCPMHEISLDAALRAHKPIVFTIASPLLCTSRTCGPVVDEVLDLRARHKSDVIFLHAEPYKGDTAGALSPAATAWKIPSEPWTWIIDHSGVVRVRFEGPVVAAEIEPALAKVL